MRAVDCIMKKRGSLLQPHGDELTEKELEFFIGGYVRGEIPDYQVSAWLMSVYFNGMSFAETGHLTQVMLNSGDVMDLSGIQGPLVDKHSTGGVGDKISLPLAPIVACCGLTVPMMSGRALGHTGGTLDKLESIEGYRVALSPAEFRSFLQKDGFAMTGQTKEIVPADRLLYALRDVTGTVESIPLITASILSKKVAEGSEALVFDVKWGSGAFMKTKEAAELLAKSLVKTAHAMGKKAAALITDMNDPLGIMIGNFLEIEETVHCLTWDSAKGKSCGPDDVMELTYALGAHMLILAEKATTVAEGIEKCRVAIASGNALQRFLANVDSQGGSSKRLLSQCGVRRSAFRHEYRAKQDGYICAINAFKTGLAGVHLGVGRNRTDESVCADAGIILHKRVGDIVHKDDLLMEVFGKNEECFAGARALLDEAVVYGNKPPERRTLIYKEIHS